MGVVRAWQCPECGQFTGSDPSEPHYGANAPGWIVCAGVPEPVFVVPASETRQGWMLEWTTRRGDEEWAVDRYMTGTDGVPKPEDIRVGVFALPEENTE